MISPVDQSIRLRERIFPYASSKTTVGIFCKREDGNSSLLELSRDLSRTGPLHLSSRIFSLDILLVFSNRPAFFQLHFFLCDVLPSSIETTIHFYFLKSEPLSTGGFRKKESLRINGKQSVLRFPCRGAFSVGYTTTRTELFGIILYVS